MAIDVASEGDTVLVGAGIFYENIYWEDKDLSVIGSGSLETILDAMQITNGAVILNVSQESILKGLLCGMELLNMVGNGLASMEEEFVCIMLI